MTRKWGKYHRQWDNLGFSAWDIYATWYYSTKTWKINNKYYVVYNTRPGKPLLFYPADKYGRKNGRKVYYKNL